MNEKRQILWSDLHLNFNDWKDELKSEHPNYSQDDLVLTMFEKVDEQLFELVSSLDMQLSQPIIIIGDIGRWNGRVQGYKMIESGNIKDCFYTDCFYTDCDLNEYYIDKLGDLRCEAVHHDGTNHYLYRVFKDNVSEEQIENLKSKLYYGKATRADITRVTIRLGDDIAKVYNITIPKQRKSIQMERAG